MRLSAGKFFTNKLTLSLFGIALAAGACDDGDTTDNTDTTAGTGDSGDGDGASGSESAGESGEGANDDGGGNDGGGNDGGGNDGEASVLVDCEELDYGLSCNDNQAAQGYQACSDHFGNLDGVGDICEANPLQTLQNEPCSSYEFPVGSCLYYSDATSDRCYVTHVGSETQEGVQAGKDFWETACAGEWMPAS